MRLRTFFAPISLLAAMIWTIWAQAAEPITVLAPFNLTGPQAALGAPCYKGAELAYEAREKQKPLHCQVSYLTRIPHRGLSVFLHPDDA